MTNLTYDQEMKLSELLFEVLEMKPCKHEIWEDGCCRECEPNLFSRSAFLDVFDAVKGREDWKERFHITDLLSDILLNAILIEDIASPHFQLEVLKWLLEKDGRLGELEEIVKGVGE